jgi:hypothetical protein
MTRISYFLVHPCKSKIISFFFGFHLDRSVSRYLHILVSVTHFSFSLPGLGVMVRFRRARVRRARERGKRERDKKEREKDRKRKRRDYSRRHYMRPTKWFKFTSLHLHFHTVSSMFYILFLFCLVVVTSSSCLFFCLLLCVFVRLISVC